jgi:hypothetical protein
MGVPADVPLEPQTVPYRRALALGWILFNVGALGWLVLHVFWGGTATDGVTGAIRRGLEVIWATLVVTAAVVTTGSPATYRRSFSDPTSTALKSSVHPPQAPS